MKYFRSDQYPIEFVLSENIVGISLQNILPQLKSSDRSYP